MIEINHPKIINYPQDLATCIKEDFKEVLAIRGGWGYGPEDVISFDRALDQPSRQSAIIEIIKHRIDYELIHMRPTGQHYEGIQWKILEQQTKVIQDRSYEIFRCIVNAHTADDWDQLRHLYAKTSKLPDFNKEEHMALHNELMRSYTCEFWFL